MLLQQHVPEWCAVAYASRVLRLTVGMHKGKRRTFGFRKFSEHVLGSQIAIETDHRPLLEISNKRLGRLRVPNAYFECPLYDVGCGKHVIKNLIADVSCRDYSRR